MSIAMANPHPLGAEEHLVLYGIDYDAYVTINDALGDRHAVRLTYVDRRLTLLKPSRRHLWYAYRLTELVRTVAIAMGIDCERAGSSTYRTSEDEVGVEGDETFYFGVHAEPMRGPVNIDLSTQPPPDLAIQVEVTLPADDAILVYGQLGVPEVWRLDVNSWTLTFCIRLEDGSYAGSSRGLALPWLEAAEILAQIRLAEDLGASNWYAHINEWARVTILPRMAEG